jgi:hypothetical protein
MGLLDSIGTYLGDEENRLRLASGFAGLSGNPNAGNIQQGLQNRLSVLQDDRKLKTAQELASSKLQLQTEQAMRLIGQEYPEIAQAIQGGFMTPNEGVMEAMRRRNAPDKSFNMLTTAEVKAAGLDTTLMYQKGSDGKIYQIGGNGTNVSVDIAAPNANQDFSNKKLYEGVGTGGSVTVNALAEGYEPARATLKQIDLLSQLGSIMDNGSAIPNALLNLLPEGSNDPLDAYRAVANGVAQGMYVPGSGTQTENDFRILLSRAGSAGMSADARILIQKGLRAATKRKMDLGAAAMAFQMNANDDQRKVYQAKVKEIQQRPLFSKEERDLLQSFGPKFDFSKLPTIHQSYAATLSNSNANAFLTMSKAMQQQLVDLYIQNKVD